MININLGTIIFYLLWAVPYFLYGQQSESEKVLYQVEREILAYNTPQVLKLIDEQLLQSSLNPDTLVMLKSLKVAALVQAEMYNEALTLSTQVIEQEKLKHPYLVRMILQRALLYEILEDQSKSESELKRVAEYYENNPKDRFYAEYLYRKVSLLRVNNEEKKAQSLAEQAKMFCTENGYTVEGAVTSMLLGLLTREDSVSKSAIHFKEALAKFSTFNDLNGMAAMHTALARLYTKNKQFELAKKYLDTTMLFSKKRKDNYLLSVAYQQKSIYFETTNQKDSALTYYKKYKIFNDLASVDKKAIAVSQLDYQFEIEKQQLERDRVFNDFKEAEKYNILLSWLFVLLAVLFLVLVYFLYNFYKKNSKIKLQNVRIDKNNAVLKKNILEKEMLLKELNHRVKNNLSLIIGLVKFQSEEIDDQHYKNKFDILEKRILAISLAHEQLLYSDATLGPSFCDLSEYLNKIAASLLSLHYKKVRYNPTIKPMQLSIETVLPIGIIINELISNSLKHAIPVGDELIITLSIEKQSGKIIIFYEDSGISFTESILKNNLGTYIIEGMISQLNGTYTRKDSAYQIIVAELSLNNEVAVF